MEDDNGSEFRYRIVGVDEFNLRENKISIDSPHAGALIGKSLDSEIELKTQQGVKKYFVTGGGYLGGLEWVLFDF